MCKDVLVCFERSDSWYSHVIRWVTKSKFNHVLIAYPSDTWGGWLATDIQFVDGVRPIILKKVMQRTQQNSIFEFYKCKKDLNHALVKTRNLIGAGYDLKGFLPILLKAYIFTRYNKLPKDAFVLPENRERIHCSEFVTTILKHAGLPGMDNMIPHLTSPGDLRRYIRNSELFVSVDNPLEKQ